MKAVSKQKNHAVKDNFTFLKEEEKKLMVVNKQ